MIGEPLDARIARRVRDTPDAAALIAADGTLDYRALWERSGLIAASLLGADRVAVLPASDTTSVVTVVGALRAGCSVVLLHRHLLPDHLTAVLDLGRPVTVLASERGRARLRRLGFHGPLPAPEELRPSPDAVAAVDSHAPDESRELLAGLTSGTTGRPKLFVRSRRSWSRTLDRSDEEFTVDQDSVVAAPGVLDHTHFLYGVLHALTRGACVDVRPIDRFPLGSAARGGVDPTHLYTVPTIAGDVAASEFVPSRVREVVSSGAFWHSTGRRALAERLPGAALVHFYGASELSLVALDSSTEAVPPGSAGRPVSGVEIAVDDGVVSVRSDMLFDGYLSDPHDPSPSGGPTDGWMSVGDRGELRGGWLFLTGRSSDTIVRGGLKVEPLDVVSALTDYPGVVDAACVGAPHPRMGQVPVAAIVVDSPVDPSALRRHLRSRLQAPALPTRIVEVDLLPRTPRGKLDSPAVLALLDEN